MSIAVQYDLFTPAATFGKVTTDPGGRGFVLDAQPHVMAWARKMFPACRSLYEKGEFTHSPMLIPDNPDQAKNLAWLMARFPLVIQTQALQGIQRLESRYDAAIAAAARGDSDTLFRPSVSALQMALPPRPHQVGFVNLARGVRRIHLADELGLGKTISAIAFLCEPDTRPALVVVPTHLCAQWQAQFKKFMPGAGTHIVKGVKQYEIPQTDVLIIAYTRLAAWQDVLVPRGLRTVVFDEVQELRHTGTQKRHAARSISERVDYAISLSATPIYNRGGEMWSVLDVVNPGALGSFNAFLDEWCLGGLVSDTLALHSYLKASGHFLRRTRESLGVQHDPVEREVVTLEGDLTTLEKCEDAAKALALSLLSNQVGVSDDAGREFDMVMRKVTGVAKAKPVAEFVKMLVEGGEKVFLIGWHRDVYDIWLKELKAFLPVMYTGSESPAQKAESVRKFVSGPSKVFICSLRSGAGLDGLQQVCNNVVFGELDWSPQVMDQVIGRLDREGQTKTVNAFFLTIDDGSDPFVMEVLAEKRSQHEGVVEGRRGDAEILADNASRSDRIRAMAEAYLASIGEAVPVVAPQSGLHAEVLSALRRLKLPTNTEREMQDALWSVLPGLVAADVQKEVRVTDRSRLDFLVTRDSERVGIECKVDHTGRAAVYRQVRRYAEEAGVTSMVIFAPWSGVADFVVEDVPVSVVDWSKARL